MPNAAFFNTGKKFDQGRFWSRARQPHLSLERASCNQQNNAVNWNFRQASSKHLTTLEPKIYLHFSKSLSKIQSANGLGSLPVGQVRKESYLPKKKMYLSRTTGRVFFEPCILYALGQLLESSFVAVAKFMLACVAVFSVSS